MLGKWSRKLGPSRLIALSFVILILTGTFLLCLPVSARDGNFTSPLDALFTATSATCVTGLIVADTFTKWSLFGQIVILILIQIGGIGLMSFISMRGIKRSASRRAPHPSIKNVPDTIRRTSFTIPLNCVFPAACIKSMRS